MLSSLFGSKSRVKLLKLFLFHPTEQYYIRQLARNLDMQINAIRRELDNLEKFGLLVSAVSASRKSIRKEGAHDDAGAAEEENITGAEAKGQEKKYYRVDTNFILFDELRSLIMKSQVMHEKRFVEKLSKLGSIDLLLLCGLFVNDYLSPVDILLVGRPGKDKVLKLIKELEIELGKEINYTLMDPEEYKYRRDITDVFLYSILERRNVKVIDEIGLNNQPR